MLQATAWQSLLPQSSGRRKKWVTRRIQWIPGIKNHLANQLRPDLRQGFGASEGGDGMDEDLCVSCRHGRMASGACANVMPGHARKRRQSPTHASCSKNPYVHLWSSDLASLRAMEWSHIAPHQLPCQGRTGWAGRQTVMLGNFRTNKRVGKESFEIRCLLWRWS